MHAVSLVSANLTLRNPRFPHQQPVEVEEPEDRCKPRKSERGLLQGRSCTRLMTGAPWRTRDTAGLFHQHLALISIPARTASAHLRRRGITATAVLVSIVLICGHATASAAGVEQLRCEYLQNPVGMDEVHPRLSWIMTSTDRGMRQSAYQICVSSTAEGLDHPPCDLWDSGKIESSRTNQIEYAGAPLRSRQQCYWKVRLWDGDDRPSAWSEPANWTMGLLDPKDWQAKWIGSDPATPSSTTTPPASEPTTTAATNPKPLPTPRYLRKSFAIAHPVKRAVVYATALGLYQLRLNGQPVGDHILAPEWTDYRKRVQYQTYDVTAQLKTGENAIGALLGNGWYCGNWQHWRKQLRPINDTTPALLAQLEIEFADGSKQMICTDESWRGTTDGPLRFSGLYEGETYDARLEMPGWDAPSFDDRNWHSANAVHPNAGALVWQRSEPIRIERELKPLTISEPKPGTYVFDLGQNMAGWCRLKVNEPTGTQLTLQFNEVLNPDGTVYMANLHAGHLSKGDRQVIHYTCRGGGETYEPHFTYQGFRYVQIDGLSTRPTNDTLTGCVFHTGFTKTGSFTCSNDLVNRLVQNIQWSQRGNMMGVPTDCCQRDERCGYTGDMNFFIQTAVFNFDIAAFASKWLNDVSDAQNPGGWYPDFAPDLGNTGPGSGPNRGWTDAGIICPYIVWQTYGDTRIIRDHYAGMQRHLAWIDSTSKNFLHVGRVGNGDWLNLGGGASDEVIGTAYDAFDYRLMSEMADAIGKPDDAVAYRAHADAIKAAFQKGEIDSTGQIIKSGQTGYALAFTMGLVPDEQRQKMSDQFAADIHRSGDHLTTGFIGTPRLLPALHLAGRDDLACQLLLRESYPSWLFEVKNGATTMWERWNGWTPERGFASSGMNSFNHYAFGSVGQYLFESLGGVSAQTPGFSRINIAPVIGHGLTRASADYDSIAGHISSHWKLDGHKLSLDITIPANTTATVTVPTTDPSTITESGMPYARAAGVKLMRSDAASAVFFVSSGEYHFAAAAGF
jgi:alpha-L-rhamnosidase